MDEVCEVAEFCRYAACESVSVSPEESKVGEIPEFWRYASGEIVASESEIGEVCEVAEFCGDAACEFVAAKSQGGQVCEVPDLCWYAACEPVVGKEEVGEVCEVAYFGGYSATDAGTSSDAGKAEIVGWVLIQVECCYSAGFNRDTCPSAYFLSCCCAPSSQRVNLEKVVIALCSPVVLDGD